MTNSSVLVLNRNYQPVHVTSAKRAFTLLYIGAARVIEPDFSTFDFDSWARLRLRRRARRHPHDDARHPHPARDRAADLRSPADAPRFASRASTSTRATATPASTARSSCRAPMLNLDHVIPRAQGGRTTWENVVCCCVPCNLKKGAKLAHEAGMKLLKKPERPRWTPTFRAPGGKVAYREWLPVPRRRRRQLLEHRAHRRRRLDRDIAFKLVCPVSKLPLTRAVAATDRFDDARRANAARSRAALCGTPLEMRASHDRDPLRALRRPAARGLLAHRRRPRLRPVAHHGLHAPSAAFAAASDPIELARGTCVAIATRPCPRIDP